MAMAVCLRTCFPRHLFSNHRLSVDSLARTFHYSHGMPASSTKNRLFASVRLFGSIPECVRSHRKFCLFSPCYRSVSRRLRSRNDQGLLLWRGFRTHRMENNLKSDNSGGFSQLLKPIAFTILVCGSSFIGAMVWQYESVREKAHKIIKRLQEKTPGEIFDSQVEKQLGFRAEVNAMWNRLSDGQKMVAGIIALNMCVFLAWKIPQYQGVLMRYFSCGPGHHVSSMLLSAFSHYNLWHIMANMYVLWSFTPASINMFGKEQWLAVYLSAATISSLASITNKALRTGSSVPSLGASGAIMCLLGAVCVRHPDARLSIAFIGEIFPHSFSASTALKAIICLDTVGLVLGWKLFDHAAHLGGVIFGIWYATYGHKLVWGNRETVMKWWHDIRGKSS